jgi:extracellular factor (EF) 3-hydroxypalmitic acid methyl ester biosynthesis protein
MDERSLREKSPKQETMGTLVSSTRTPDQRTCATFANADSARDSQLCPGYRTAVHNLTRLLHDLRCHLGDADTMYANKLGCNPFDRVWPNVEIQLEELFREFEEQASAIAPDAVAPHKAFAQRELHPLLMCDPFIHRSFTKPLGYAGDYQIVKMILEAKSSMASTYARVVSTFNLTRAPAVAHRNRVDRLEDLLRQEARRRAQEGGRLRVLNVGCGPAIEVERFVSQGREAAGSHLTLVDFNEETLAYVRQRLAQALARSKVTLDITAIHRSIHELLKPASNGESSLAGSYDLIYCAGLFDYLSETVCKRLVRLFYDCTSPGGLVLITNVHAKNPIRYYMAHVAEWDLEHRDESQCRSLASNTPADVLTDATGMNIFLEVRRPAI